METLKMKLRSARYSKQLTPHDQRGFTLQTLIITAVLVLLAVAGGVIIAAITGSASDDLEAQQPSLEGRCAPWEFHDPVLAAVGGGGGEEFTEFRYNPTSNTPQATPGNGGYTSSGIGCFAPCYVEREIRVARVHTLDDLMEPVQVTDYDTGTRMMVEAKHSYIKFKTDNSFPAHSEYRIGVTYFKGGAGDSGNTELMNVNYEHFDIQNPHDGVTYVPNQRLKDATRGSTNGYAWRWDGPYGSNPNVYPVGTNVPPTDQGSTLSIKVTTDGDGCVVYDTVTNDILLDSRLG